MSWWSLAVLFLFVALWLSLTVPTRWLAVVHVHPGLGLGKKALQISDLHVEMLRVPPERLRDVARAEAVDYIFITGDFLTKDRYLPRVEHLLRVLAQVGVPMFAVLGNHDYRMRRVQSLIDLLDRFGVQRIDNASVRTETCWIVGIGDSTTGHSHPRQAFSAVDAGGDVASLPIVVLTHNPNVIFELRHPFDYLMAGHLHGKQFAIPGLFLLKPMGPLPRRGVYRGLHRLPEGLLYISSGVSQVGLNLRFLVRAEVTVHHL
ncbi:MAG: metallophosphoesterase [Alicyclobacillus sp.]|nr:metallophosphoesterase [Alicyclobacillus sp.]